MRPYLRPHWTDSHQIWSVNVFHSMLHRYTVSKTLKCKNKFFCGVIASVLYKHNVATKHGSSKPLTTNDLWLLELQIKNTHILASITDAAHYGICAIRLSIFLSKHIHHHKSAEVVCSPAQYLRVGNSNYAKKNKKTHLKQIYIQVFKQGGSRTTSLACFRVHILLQSL